MNMKKQTNINARNKVILSTLFFLTILVAIYIFKAKENFHLVSENKHGPSLKLHSVDDLKVSSHYIQLSKTLTRKAPEKTKISNEAMTFLRDLQKDKSFSLFFNYTLKFFDGSKAAYPAARFVGLSMLFDSSAENFYLRSWTQKEIVENSEEIMKVLENKVDEIDINPYFHSRMLNLAFQLNVSKERKLSFFSKTLDRPLQVLENGELSDYSLNFETALILSKQSNAEDTEIGIPIIQAISANKTDLQKKALKDRVLTYYPDLSYMF